MHRHIILLSLEQGLALSILMMYSAQGTSHSWLTVRTLPTTTVSTLKMLVCRVAMPAAQKETLDLLVAVMSMKAESRFVPLEAGAQSVMIFGEPLMLKLPADLWVYRSQVSSAASYYVHINPYNY